MTKTSESPAPARIAIVGAGPAGLSTALHLTDEAINPGWRERYEVHVYQMGWRAGGKGATGRNASANERIEEHGIHLFGNFYFNASRMLQSVAAEVEWDEHDRYRTMDEMLLPSRTSSRTDWVDGRWVDSLNRLMTSEGDPWKGDPVLRSEHLVTTLLEHLAEVAAKAHEAHAASGAGVLDRFAELSLRLGRLLGRWVSKIENVAAAERSSPSAPNGASHNEIVALLSEAVKLLGLLFKVFPHNVNLRGVYIHFDMMVTFFRGLVDDEVEAHGIDSIDGENYRDWLARHGASQATLTSGFPQAIPNTALSYEFGDTTRVPSMSAAAYANFVARWIMGTGAGAYFFAQGTGDTVVKPVYRLLVQRGVKFHWFHKLRDVEASADGADVERITFDVQATVKADDYDPLRRLDDGELVWPNQPLYEQLVEGDELRQGDELEVGGYNLESWWTAWKPVGELVLERDADFDHVVLATPISTLKPTCGSLIANDRTGRWQAMTDSRDGVKSAATQSVQLWVNRTTKDLGWDGELEGHDRYLGGIYGQDLTSYCDFSDLIEQERWPADNRPKGLIYLIGALSDPDEVPPFDDHDFPNRERERIKWMTVQYLRNIDGLLPRASGSPIDSRSFDFDALVPTTPGTISRGVNQISDQHISVNIDPNERYTLTVKGTAQHRLDAWDSKFGNLVLAGDWIYTGWNVGSFEGAVMGGKLASLALTGAPDLEAVWGYSFMQQPRPAPPPPPFPALPSPSR